MMNKTLKRFLLILFGGIGIYYVYNAISNQNNEGENKEFEPYIPTPLDIDPDIDVPEEEISQEEF